MAAALLDINVLVALAWPNHVHHQPAHKWFAASRSRGWATCLFTQAAFVRLSAQPAVAGATIPVREAIRLLEANLSAADHEFWPMPHGIPQLMPEIRERLVGHHQLSDALLLDLAIRNGGTLATFDRRLESLLAPASIHQAALEILPVE